MKPFIQITRHLYEEPYALNLVIIACNGRAMGSLEFYLKPEDLENIGTSLLDFPRHEKASYIFERGSEHKKDNFGWYLKLELTSPGGLQNRFTMRFRFNNNEHNREFHFAVDPQVTDFGFVMTGEDVRNLGKLISNFSKLEHHRLYWNPDSISLDDNLSNLSGYSTNTVENALKALPE